MEYWKIRDFTKEAYVRLSVIKALHVEEEASLTAVDCVLSELILEAQKNPLLAIEAKVLLTPQI